MFNSFNAVDNTSEDIGQDEEDHATQHRGNEEFIEQIDGIYDGVMFGAGLVVTHPRTGKVDCRIGMATLAFDEQVFAQRNPGFRIIHFGNIVHAMTVGTNRFIGGLTGKFLFEKFYGRAVEIGHIGVKHVGGDPVLIHNGRICMAFGAQEGCAISETDRGGILNIMDTMAINTGWHIGIIFLGERIPVHAGFICVVNSAMTF